jgi:hypothetical protein
MNSVKKAKQPAERPAPKFKYDQYLTRFPGCPTANTSAKNVAAFRLAKNQPLAPSDFVPALLETPARINDPMFDTDRMKCKGYAISLYNSKEAIVSRFSQVFGSKPKLREKLGTKIAKGKLSQTDGLAESPDQSGHFDFFEYEGCELALKFQVIDQIS